VLDVLFVEGLWLIFLSTWARLDVQSLLRGLREDGFMAGRIKLQFLNSDRPLHGYVYRNTLILEVSVSHFKQFPYSREEILDVERAITAYLRKVLNVNGNPLFRLVRIHWGERRIRER